MIIFAVMHSLSWVVKEYSQVRQRKSQTLFKVPNTPYLSSHWKEMRLL